MSQQKPARKPLPALSLFDSAESDHTGVESRLGFSAEESTMITSLERLEGSSTTGVNELELPVEELLPEDDFDSEAELSTSSLNELTPISPPELPLRSEPPSISLKEQSAEERPTDERPTDERPLALQPPEPVPVPVSVSEPVPEPVPVPVPELREPYEPVQSEPEPARSSLAMMTSTSGAPSGGRGVMISAFNSRGGVGSTSLLISLAGALQTRGFRVVIVDMDLQLATLSASLEVKLERSLAELVMETLSAEGPIRSAFDQHKSGVSLIAQEERISEISAVTPERLPRFFSALKQGFDVILVDGLRNFSDLAVAVMDEADMVLLPVTQDIPAVRSARKVLKLFTRLGYEGGKARVILNRFHKRSLVTPEVIEEHLRCVISERLPNDFRFVSQGLTEGELLHHLDPQHPFCLAIDRLAAQLMGFPTPDQRQGLLKRIGRALRRS